MLNINLTSKLSTTVIGLLIFFVPFFTYLSPENLKQLSRPAVLEIFLSLIALLIVIFIISLSVEMLIKRFFKKKNILFPLLCFAFYLNFFYIPFEEFLCLKLGSCRSIGILVFIFFELCCLAIIAFGTKFNVFSIRMILIFSILMLINTFIPLVGYLSEDIGKKPTISYEINSRLYAQDAVLIKRNVYYIIARRLVAIDTLEPFNIVTKEEVIDKLSNTELKYIDKSQSSYTDTLSSLTSLMLLDYHRKPSSTKYSDSSTAFPSWPHMMYNTHNEIPLFSYLKKANSSFYWQADPEFGCRRSIGWTCLNPLHSIFPPEIWNFYLTTPLPKIYQRILNKNTGTPDSLDEFLKYIDKNGMPKTPFFAFINDAGGNVPYLVTNECEPTNYFNQNFEGYKASYQCTLKKVKMFMEKINNIDPEAIVVFQGDHGLRKFLNLELTEKEKYLFAGSIFNAIKAPEICFDKYGLPKTNVNTIRFALNCAYGFKLPYRKNIHYEINHDLGIVVERKLYE